MRCVTPTSKHLSTTEHIRFGHSSSRMAMGNPRKVSAVTVEFCNVKAGAGTHIPCICNVGVDILITNCDSLRNNIKQNVSDEA
jgi:hypothetical protein